MAIQNFIGGGFANKLGEMVGYHAKGKWIVRTWVKTPQPNTPDQITNRWRFAHLIFAAQLGLRYSGRQGFLPSDTRSEFQSRSSWAGDRWKLGQQGIGLVYLQPDRPTITTDVSSFIQPSGDGMSARVFHCSFPRSAPSMRGFSAILSWANSLEKDSADVYTGSCADNIWYQAFEISSGFSLKKPWAELVEGELTTLASPAPGSWSRGYAAPVPVGEPRWIHMGLASAIAWMVEAPQCRRMDQTQLLRLSNQQIQGIQQSVFIGPRCPVTSRRATGICHPYGYAHLGGHGRIYVRV